MTTVTEQATVQFKTAIEYQKNYFVWVSLYNTGLMHMRDDPYWICRKNSIELIELCSINKVSLV